MNIALETPLTVEAFNELKFTDTIELNGPFKFGGLDMGKLVLTFTGNDQGAKQFRGEYLGVFVGNWRGKVCKSLTSNYVQLDRED